MVIDKKGEINRTDSAENILPLTGKKINEKKEAGSTLKQTDSLLALADTATRLDTAIAGTQHTITNFETDSAAKRTVTDTSTRSLAGSMSRPDTTISEMRNTITNAETDRAVERSVF